MANKLSPEEIKILSAIIAGKANSADEIEQLCVNTLAYYQKAISIFTTINTPNSPPDDNGLLDYYKLEAEKHR